MFGERIIEGARFGAYGNCVINAWQGPPQQSQLDILGSLLERVTPQHAQGILFFVVLEPGSPFMDTDQRKDVEAFYARWTPSFGAVVQVVEGGNLWSVTARSVMTAMRLVQRRPYPTKVFSDVEEGTDWAAQFLRRPDNDTDVEDPAQALLDNINRLRALPVTG